MDVTVFQCVAFSLILLLGSFVQGAIGFAAGLLMIPMLVMIGLSLPVAVTVNLVVGTVQNVAGSYQLRGELDVRRTIRPILIRLVFLPIGVYFLWLAGALSRQHVKQIVGAIVLAIVVLQWRWRVEPREQLHAAWEWLAFSTSGFLLGFCGMGAPPAVLWVAAHRWSSAQSRAFIFFTHLTGAVPQTLLLCLFFGRQIVPGFMLGLLGMPVVLLGTFFGLRCGARLGSRRLRAVSYGVLAIIAIIAIAGPMLTVVLR